MGSKGIVAAKADVLRQNRITAASSEVNVRTERLENHIHTETLAKSAALAECVCSALHCAKPMKERIVIDPHVHFGKPCVAGTRIPVQNVLELIEEGLSFAEITRDYYPQLKADDIQACVQYAREVIAAEDLHVSTS
jgi:uncharacterized protein (DUF433 family)